jgi:hypothetical protein
LKGKISFSILETVLTVPGELDYLEGLVKLARRCKDEKKKQVIHIVVVHVVPTIK